MTREYNPDAITLDIHLPDIDGWRVLERLKKDPATRHVPVCVVCTDEAKDRALSSGCLAFLGKPIQSRDVLDGLLDHLTDYLGRPARHLLVVEPDPARREQMKARLADPDVLVTAVADSASALRTLADEPTDCVVLGPGATDLEEGLLSLNGLSGSGASDADGSATVSTRLPVIVYGEHAIDSRAFGVLEARRRRVYGPASAHAGRIARSGDVLPPPSDRQTAGSAAQPARRDAPNGQNPLGPKSADRGRRHPEHLRTVDHSRRARHGDRVGRQRTRRDRHAPDRPGRRDRPDGHHDARNGRHGNNAAKFARSRS